MLTRFESDEADMAYALKWLANDPAVSVEPMLRSLGERFTIIDLEMALRLRSGYPKKWEQATGRPAWLSMTVESGPRIFAQKEPRFWVDGGHDGERPIRRSWSGLHSLIGRGSFAFGFSFESGS